MESDRETLELKRALFNERLVRVQLQGELLRIQFEQATAELKIIDEALKALPPEPPKEV